MILTSIPAARLLRVRSSGWGGLPSRVPAEASSNSWGSLPTGISRRMARVRGSSTATSVWRLTQAARPSGLTAKWEASPTPGETTASTRRAAVFAAETALSRG